MSDPALHKWEHVDREIPHGGGFSMVTYRIRVPGGWVYHVTLMRRRFLFWNSLYTSAAFVPQATTE